MMIGPASELSIQRDNVYKVPVDDIVQQRLAHLPCLREQRQLAWTVVTMWPKKHRCVAHENKRDPDGLSTAKSHRLSQSFSTLHFLRSSCNFSSQLLHKENALNILSGASGLQEGSKIAQRSPAWCWSHRGLIFPIFPAPTYSEKPSVSSFSLIKLKTALE